MNRPAKKKEAVVPVYCEACQIAVNSSSQAENHFKGHSHAKTIAKLQNGLPTTAIPYSSNPNEPGQKVLIMKEDPNTHIMSTICAMVPMSLMEKKRRVAVVVHCQACNFKFNSQEQADAHFKGGKHLRKLKSFEKKTPGKAADDLSMNNLGRSRCMFACSVCKVSLNSSNQFEQHCLGANHRKHTELVASQDMVAGNRSGWYYCNICDVSCPSSILLHQHVMSREHKDTCAKKTMNQGIHQ